MDSFSSFCVKVVAGHDDWVRAIAVHKMKPLVATTSADQTVRLWDGGGGFKPIATLRGHENSVDAVAFAPQVAQDAALKGAVRLSNRFLLLEPPPHSHFYFDPPPGP